MTARPFLKWAGGKRSLLPELLKRVPASFGTYHEPFLGGGALFFALQPKVAHLGDLNAALVKAYNAVQSDVGGLISRLRCLASDHCVDTYYARRAMQPSEDIDVGAWMIYLNKTCFNGLWRVNRKGQFNVPIGKYEQPAICDAPTLRECAKAFGPGVSVRCEGFEAALDRAVAGDLVYFDPPYVPLSATASFAQYTAGGFGPKDQERLRDVALTLKRRGVHVLLSNSGSPEAAELYADSFTVDAVAARRAISSKGQKRGPVTEFVIT